MLYVIADGKGRVKIGITRTPTTRFRDLQTGDADRHGLVLLLGLQTLTEEARLEANFHAAFGRFRCPGGREWYVLVPELRAWAQALMAKPKFVIEGGD